MRQKLCRCDIKKGLEGTLGCLPRSLVHNDYTSVQCSRGTGASHAPWGALQELCEAHVAPCEGFKLESSAAGVASGSLWPWTA